MGLSEPQLAEFVEAATTVGYPAGLQNPKHKNSRPDNGFIGGVNGKNIESFQRDTGINSYRLADLASWPDMKK